MASSAALELVIGVQDKASGPLSRISESVGGLGKLAGGVALGGVAALTGGFIGAIAEGLQFNNTLEQTTAKMTAFTGSEEEAAKVLDMVRERAAKTPFAFNEMADAAAAFLPLSKQTGVALETYIEQAEVLAALNPAEGLSGAAFALREAAGGDFLSIVERFNLPKQRLMELKEQGVPALEAVKTALAEMGVDASLVAGLGETMSGRWSTFKDTLTGIAATATSGLFEGMAGGLEGLQGALDANMPQIQAFAQAFGEGLGNAVSWLIDTGFPGLIGAWETLSPIFMSWSAALSESLVPAFDVLKQAFAWVIDTGIPALQSAFTTAWPLIQQAVDTAISYLRDVAWPWLQQGFAWLQDTALPPLKTTFESVWSAAKVAVETAYLFLKDVVWPWLQQGFGLLKDTVLPDLRAAFEEVWPKIQAAVQAVFDWLKDTMFPWLQNTAFPWLADVALPALKVAFETAWSAISTAVRTVYTFLRDTVWPWLRDTAFPWLKDTALPALKVAFETAWSAISTAVDTAYVFLRDTVWPWLQTAMDDIGTWITEAKDTWNTAWGAIGGAVDTAKNTISTAIATIKSLVDGAITRINNLITLINTMPGINIPTIPTAPTGGGGSGFGDRSIGGTSTMITIDARGASDPRGIERAVERGMRRSGVTTDLITRTR